MDLTLSYLAMGISITIIGVILIILSLKASSDEIEHKVAGIIFIGPIPIILRGPRFWIATLFVLSSLIIIILSIYQPRLIGGQTS